MYKEISAQEFEQLVISDIDAEIIDVREKNEWDMIRIPRAKLIPLSSIEHRLGDIDFSKSVYVFCRTGGRSGQVCAWLESEGKTATNIAGSIKKLYEVRSPILEITEKFISDYLV